MVEIKENRHLIRPLELHLFLVYFPEKCMKNEATTAIANTLKKTPDRKGGGRQKKGLKVASADFSKAEIENDKGLIVLEEEEDVSSDNFDEM